jgi:phosphoglycerol transferase MdoB-like AlkP superfamily enzyme
MTTHEHHLDAACPEGPALPDTATVGDSGTGERGRTLRHVVRQAVRLARPFGIYLVFAAVVAVTAELVLEAARTGWNWAYLLDLVTARLGVVAISALVLLLVVGIVLAVTGSMWVTATLVLGLATVMGMASDIKYVARREPIYPRDLVFMLEPRFLLEMVAPGTLWMALLGLLALVALTWGLSKLFTMWLRRRPTEKPPRWWVTVIGMRLVVVVVSVTVLSSLLQFNHTGNSWRRAYESAGAHWAKASQPNNYRVNGFLGGFLYNLDIPAMTRPPAYSPETMDRIVAKYTDLARSRNAGRDPDALADVNVVSVLAESFSDPSRLSGVTLGTDPLVRTRELMETVPHGLTLTHKVGGGTSSMEFEVLTGMSLSQFSSAMDTPYQMLVPNHRTFPSAVELFNQLGHRTLAIHPYQPTMYQRDRVYPILGFSDFVARADMTYRGKRQDNPYIADQAAFFETMEAIESHDEPVFVNLVTMQNHMPYADRYADPVEVEGLGPEGEQMFGQYARGLAYTDRAIRRFIKELERSPEKTIVLLYGDHLPAGLPAEVFEQNSERVLHETPFFIYSNFGKVDPVELPTTSGIFFLPQIFDLAGAPLPPYFAMLRELQTHVSALQHGRLISPGDYEMPPHWLSPRAREVLRDYRLVQYDLAVGGRYSEEMLYPTPPETVAASGSGE